MAYNGSVDLISGIRPKNNGTFPLVDAKDVYVTDDKRLDAALDEKMPAADALPKPEAEGTEGQFLKNAADGATAWGDVTAEEVKVSENQNLDEVLAEKADAADVIQKPAVDGTEGQHLEIDANGDPVWLNPGTPTDTQVGDAVAAWLTAHPEATTTVQDGTITRAKLDADLQEKTDAVPELKSAINDIADSLFDESYVVVCGSGEFATDDTFANKGSYNVYLFANPVSESTQINKVKIRAYSSPGSDYKFKLISVRVQGNQLFINKVSNEITLNTPSGTFTDNEVVLETAFEIPSGCYAGIVASDKQWFRNSSSGNQAYFVKSDTYESIVADYRLVAYIPNPMNGSLPITLYGYGEVIKDFITEEEADEKYLSIQDASENYLSKTEAESEYLKIADAIQLDSTLSDSTKAAESKTTGDAIKNLSAYTLPNNAVVWEETGYYRVATQAKVESSDYLISNPIKVRPGDTIYVYSEAISDHYLIIAYSIFGNIDFSNSYGSASAVSKNVAYTVPQGVEFIRVTSGAASAYLVDVITEQYQFIGSSIDKLYVDNDISCVRFDRYAGYSTTTKRPVYNASYDSRLTSHYAIPLHNIVEFGYTNPDYEVTFLFMDSDYSVVSTKTVNKPTFIRFDGFPANSKYIQVTLIKNSSSSVSVSDSGFYIISDLAVPTINYIKEHEQEYLENWDRTSLMKAVTVSDPSVELMAHGASVYDGEDGYTYVAYYANHDNHTEGLGQPIKAKLAKVSQWDMSDREIYIGAVNGQDFTNFVQSSSSYDPIMIPKSSSVYSYIFQALPTNGTYTTVVIEFDKTTNTFSTVGEVCNFKYTLNGMTYTVPMNCANLSIFVDRLFGVAEGTKNFGQVPLLQKPVLYNGAYYAYLGGGNQAQNANTGYAGCIIKTADYGHTWEFVAYNDEFTDKVVCCLEWSLDISPEGNVYCSLRAVWHGEPVGTSYYTYYIATVYNLTSGIWHDTTFLCSTFDGVVYDSYYDDISLHGMTQITVDFSRTLTYIVGDYVYFFANILPRMKTTWKPNGVYRSTMRIYKFDKSMNRISAKSYYNDAGVHYFAAANIGGRQYLCFTEDVRHLDNDTKGDIAIIPLEELLP